MYSHSVKDFIILAATISKNCNTTGLENKIFHCSVSGHQVNKVCLGQDIYVPTYSQQQAITYP